MQRDVRDHNDDGDYEEMHSADPVWYSQLDQPINDGVYSNVQHQSAEADQQYGKF